MSEGLILLVPFMDLLLPRFVSTTDPWWVLIHLGSSMMAALLYYGLVQYPVDQLSKYLWNTFHDEKVLF
jgi:ABC-type arginine/histidine transport system permease subunit